MWESGVTIGRDEAVAIFLVVVLLSLVLRWRLRRRRRRGVSTGAGPTGLGAALALTLEGDLPSAQRLLVDRVRAAGDDRPDALIGLVALLRACGESGRALALVERMRRSGMSGEWLDALAARVALDAGDLERAERVRKRARALPIDLELAILVRAGRWSDAIERYRSRVPRRQRAREVESALCAGLAAGLAQQGDERGARRALKRALSLNGAGLLPLWVAARWAGRPNERARAVERVAEQLRPEGISPGAAGINSPAAEEAEVVASARRDYAAGERHRALGRLRDHLDAHPRSQGARLLYGRWILEDGEPGDWRGELAEHLRALECGEDGQAARSWRCTRCEFADASQFFICPSCDALGTLAPEHTASSAARSAPSSRGARLDDLLGESPEGHRK